jgi:hypothetical protein
MNLLKNISNFSRFLIVLALLLGYAIFYFGYTALGGTQIATTFNLFGPSTTLDDGLVGHWTFDGPIVRSDLADEILDSSGNGYDGGFDIATPTIGAIGQALSFDGNQGSFVDLGTHAASFDLDANYTLMAWIKPAVSDAGVVLKRGAASNVANQQQFRIDIESGDIEYTTADGTTCDVDTFGTVAVDEWSHVVCTHGPEGGDKNCYVNGVQSGSTQTDDQGVYEENEGFMAIGADDANSGTPFTGAIDDVRIYDRVLSLDEIRQLYRMGR